MRPQRRAGLQVEGHHRVARFRRRGRVRIAGRDVDRVALRIDRRRGPHGRARRPVHLRADGILLRRTRLLRNRVHLPLLLAGRRVVRDERATEGAALVFRVRAGALFERRDGHVEAPVVERRRAGDARERVRLGVVHPDLVAVLRVDGVDVRFHVTEVGRVARAGLADRNCGPHAAPREERPVHAS